MKKHLETIFGTMRSVMLATITCALIFGPTSAMAATNTATWDISGVAQGPATFDLISFNSGAVSLTKTAFLVSDGSELIDGASVPANTVVDFMIFINNKNLSAVNNINVADILAPADFVYSLTTMQFGTTAECTLQACDTTERAALYAAATNPYTDAPGDDAASYTAGTTTISAGLSGGDTQLNVPAQTTWALVFRATVQ